MKKIGPFSADTVIALAICDLQKDTDVPISFSKLYGALKNKFSKTTILNSIDTLNEWGVVRIEFGETEKGRAGRLFTISGESRYSIEQIYKEYWDKIQLEMSKISEEV